LNKIQTIFGEATLLYIEETCIPHSKEIRERYFVKLDDPLKFKLLHDNFGGICILESEFINKKKYNVRRVKVE
jgi:hypothetical protein